MKLHVTDNRTINFIQFENIKIAIDRDTCMFISGIDKNNDIKMYEHTKEKLLKKFKIDKWDSLDYNKNLFHIKFLVKYSPILSKFIDASELDTIKFIPSSYQVVGNWNNTSYIKFNDGKEFFNVYDVACTGQDIICLKVNSEFLKILERR